MNPSRPALCVPVAAALSLSLWAGLGCAGDEAPAPPTDDSPLVVLVAPAPGEVPRVGEEVALIAAVNDTEDALDTLEVRFASSQDGPLGTASVTSDGEATLLAVLQPGPHTITATVVDSADQTSTAQGELVVNRPPDPPTVAVEPAHPFTTSTLTAYTVDPAVDLDRDPLTEGWRWTRDGDEVPLDGPQVPAAQTRRGETWSVRLVVSDGLAEAPAAVASVTIGNSPPQCLQARILPESGAAAATPFVCVCTDPVDPDPDDEVAITCALTVDGAQVPPGDDGCAFPTVAKGAELGCTITPDDGDLAGAPVGAAKVVAKNSPPTPPSGISVSPQSPTALSTLKCVVAEPGTDADGEPLDHVFTWLVGDTERLTGPSSVGVYELAAPGVGPPAKGNAIRCSVVASDGEASSTPALSAPVVLVNATPQGGVVTVQPEEVKEGDTLECTITGAIDPDGDPLAQLTTWRVDGLVVDGAESPELTSEHFDKGQEVTCAAASTDGEAVGVPVESENSALVLNTLPTLLSATLEPVEATLSETLTCSFEGWFDPDPEDATPTVIHTWWLFLPPNDKLVLLEGALTPTLDAKELDADIKVFCRVVPLNGAELGPSIDSNTCLVLN